MAHHFFDTAPHFRPYRWSGPQMQVGLQPIKAAEWLILDTDYGRFMQAKQEHLIRASARCYAALPSSLAAQSELRTMVAEHLVEQHPQMFSRSGAALGSPALGRSWDLNDSSLEPLWQLSQFVQEDFMLLQEIDGQVLITAASNAYSSSGRLVAAVGRDIRWAHEPVPKLTAMHGSRIDRILASVHEGALCARYNWQLTPLASIFFPEDPHSANMAALKSVSTQLSRDPSLTPSLLNVRVERQTLRRLPLTRAVAFSIHTYSDPLSSLSTDLASLEALLALLQSYPPERLRYNEMDSIHDGVVAWLESLLVTHR
jgi:dimethylamine monooxygenase subunit A